MAAAAVDAVIAATTAPALATFSGETTIRTLAVSKASCEPRRRLEGAAAFSGGVFATLQRALGPGAAEERRARLLSDDAAQIAAHQLEPDEWRWLTDRIGRDDDTDPNEQALIDFVLADSKTPPIVTGLAAQDDVIPHFGRRQAS